MVPNASPPAQIDDAYFVADSTSDDIFSSYGADNNDGERPQRQNLRRLSANE
jgi:hypothetical protein